MYRVFWCEWSSFDGQISNSSSTCVNMSTRMYLKHMKEKCRLLYVSPSEWALCWKRIIYSYVLKSFEEEKKIEMWSRDLKVSHGKMHVKCVILCCKMFHEVHIQIHIHYFWDWIWHPFSGRTVDHSVKFLWACGDPFFSNVHFCINLIILLG